MKNECIVPSPFFCHCKVVIVLCNMYNLRPSCASCYTVCKYLQVQVNNKQAHSPRLLIVWYRYCRKISVWPCIVHLRHTHSAALRVVEPNSPSWHGVKAEPPTVHLELPLHLIRPEGGSQKTHAGPRPGIGFTARRCSWHFLPVRNCTTKSHEVNLRFKMQIKKKNVWWCWGSIAMSVSLD